MDPGMWIAEVPVLSDAPLMPFKVAEERSIETVDCESMLPRLASWSAAKLPSRPTCAGIHWKLTAFKKPIADRTVQME